LIALGQIGQWIVAKAPEITVATTALLLFAFGLFVTMLSYPCFDSRVKILEVIKLISRFKRG
jgi:uncharacterized paraquat-inducible protein A